MRAEKKCLKKNEADQEDDRDPGSCVREKYAVPQSAIDRAMLGVLSDHRCLRECLGDRQIVSRARFVLSQRCGHGKIVTL